MDGDAERTMRDELENALGRQVTDEEARAALDRPAPTLAHWVREQQLLIIISACAALVVGALLAVTLGSWWLLAAALVVHALASLLVGYVSLRLTAEVEKPDPQTVAKLQAHGVDDPEARLNRAIQALGGGNGDEVREAFEVDAEGRDGAAAQQLSITPSSEETDLVGPDAGRRNGRR